MKQFINQTLTNIKYLYKPIGSIIALAIIANLIARMPSIILAVNTGLSFASLFTCLYIAESMAQSKETPLEEKAKLFTDEELDVIQKSCLRNIKNMPPLDENTINFICGQEYENWTMDAKFYFFTNAIGHLILAEQVSENVSKILQKEKDETLLVE